MKSAGGMRNRAVKAEDEKDVGRTTFDPVDGVAQGFSSVSFLIIIRSRPFKIPPQL